MKIYILDEPTQLKVKFPCILYFKFACNSSGWKHSYLGDVKFSSSNYENLHLKPYKFFVIDARHSNYGHDYGVIYFDNYYGYSRMLITEGGP